MNARRLGLALVAAVLAVTAVWPAIAHAAAAPTKIVMQKPNALPVIKSDPQSVMVLGAILSTADGKPVSNQRVEFLMATNILGQKQASVGSAVTDAAGSARTTFIVNKTGPYELSARFAGTEALGASEAPPLKADFEALPPKPISPDDAHLDLIGSWLPWAALSLGGVVWATMLFVLARVILVVPRAGRGGD